MRLAGDSISCAIHPYFLRHDGNSNEVLTGTDIETLITDRYEAIKHLIVNKKNATLEKMAQQALVMQNNASHVSKWYCVDVEWARSFNNQAEKDSCMASRMDIIAISKEAPHRVAIIELKYGSKSINGNAGVMKHIQDFRTLKEGSIHDGSRIDYYEGMCTDICNILRAYEALGIALPETLRNLNNEAFALKPEFYVLTLDNNAASWGHTTPKQTMAAYLFSPYSHNRAFGEAFARGESFEGLAEGYYTVRALVDLADATGVDLPICRAVEAVLYRGESLSECIKQLFERSLKPEF